MWLFTETGFMSAVRHRTSPDNLVVRARDRQSLLELSEFSKEEIQFTPYADYPYRVIVHEKQLRTFMDDALKNLKYDNFKSRVQKTRGLQFVDALQDVWATMHKVEDLESANRWEKYPVEETLPGFDDSPDPYDYDSFPDWEPDEKS